MFGRRRKQRDFSEEIQAHLELEIERMEESGLSREEAEREARRKFGNVTRNEERFYEAQRWMWFDHLGQDLRFAVRMVRRSPGFTVVAVLTLALGIGANTAIFSLVQAVLLRPLPFPQPDRLVSVWELRPSSREAKLPVSGHEYVAWSEQSRSFEALAMYTSNLSTITGGGEPETITVGVVSANFFAVLGAPPALGRVLLPGEDRAGAGHVAVVADQFWRRRFGSDKKIIGSTITLDSESYLVVGVMPPLPKSFSPDVWTAMDVPGEARKVGRHSMNVLGRLKPEVTMAQAQSDLDIVAKELERRMPGENTDHKVVVVPARQDLTEDVHDALLMLMGAVGFVLLIACLNVAGLLLTRANGREHEIAIRKALGASRMRLVRQLVTESLLLAGMGGVVGVVLAVWLARLLPHVRGVNIPLVETIAIDGPALAVTTVLSLVSGVIAGVTPALRASRMERAQAIKESRQVSATPARQRLGSALVALQVAIALALLTGAGLLMKSLVRLLNVDTGFSSEHVLVTSTISLPEKKYSSPFQSRAFFDSLLERVAALPGVQSAGFITNLPLQGSDNWSPFSIEGRPAPPPGQALYAQTRVASLGYFRALEIPLRSGRIFNQNDARLALPLIRWYEQQAYPKNFAEPQPIPVAVISESMARQYWPGENPVGKRLRVLFSPWITVIGVVGDVKHNALDAPAYPCIYLPYSQEPWGAMTLVVRSSGKPSQLARAVREQVRAGDADLPVAISEMDAVLAGSVGRQRFYTMLASAFGALALALAVIGVFAMASYSVSQRVREIGVRMALGAQRGNILWLILGHGLMPIAIGALAGAAGALGLATLIKSFLYHVSPADPGTLMTAVLLVFLASVLALWIPARRAMRVDPNVALRWE
jgi:putative ABC transport system permease protein